MSKRKAALVSTPDSSAREKKRSRRDSGDAPNTPRHDPRPPSSDMNARARLVVNEDSEEAREFTGAADKRGDPLKYWSGAGPRDQDPEPAPKTREPESLIDSDDESDDGAVGASYHQAVGNPNIELEEFPDHVASVDASATAHDVEKYLNKEVVDPTAVERALQCIKVKADNLLKERVPVPSKFLKFDSASKLGNIWNLVVDIRRLLTTLEAIQAGHEGAASAASSSLVDIDKTKAAFAAVNDLRAKMPPGNALGALLAWSKALEEAVTECMGFSKKFALVCREMVYRNAIEFLLTELTAMLRLLGEYDKDIGDDTFVRAAVRPWLECLGNKDTGQHFNGGEPAGRACSTCQRAMLDRYGRLFEKPFAVEGGAPLCLTCKLRAVDKIECWTDLLGVREEVFADHVLSAKRPHEDEALHTLLHTASKKFLGF